MLRAAVLAAIVATLPAAAYAQCLGGDWQCWHNHQHNRMMDSMGDPAADAARAAERAQQSALQAEQSKVLELQRRVLLRQIYPPAVADCEWQRTKSKGLLNMLGELLEPKADPCDAILAAYHRQKNKVAR